MEQTYLCKFDSEGRRTETLLTCEFTEEEKAEKIAEGYIEISEDEYDADCVVLYITVEDSDGYETEYELTVWLAY
jgi:hypothetical protein